MRKNKGNKVYPSPSLSSNKNALSALSLLPAAILALASVLSLEDCEVLGYLISRSINTTTNTTSSSLNAQDKKKCKKSSHNNKHPIFDCGCFDCYTSFWFRWDSSPNRELINQAIEAFEEHLTKGELSSPSMKKGSGGGGKKKDKMGRRVFDQKPERDQSESFMPILSEMVMVPEIVVVPLTESDRDEYVEVMNEDEEEIEIEVVMATTTTDGNLTHSSSTETVQLPANKGLVRKVLPDILGVFNSRLWSLWNPSV